MNRTYGFLFLIIGILSLCIISVYGAETDNAATIILKSDDPFWNQVRAGIMDAVSEDEIDLSIITSDTPYLSDEMVILAFDAIEKTPAMLIISPTDVSLFSPVIKAAENANIPVILLESPLSDDIAAGYVGSDNAAIGVLAAQDMAELLGEKGAVAVLSHNAQDPGSLIRKDFFSEQIQTQYPDMEVSAHYPDSDSSLSQFIESMLSDNPQLKGIFSTDSDSTLALGKAIQALGLTGSVAIIGVDGGDEVFDLVTKGVIQETIMQDPYEMGHVAGEQLKAYYENAELQPAHFIDFITIVTDVPFTGTQVAASPVETQATLTPTPAQDKTDGELSYNERLQAASGKYDFGTMADQAAASHYSTVNQIAQQQAALSASMSGGGSGRSGHWCPTCGSGLVWVP
ncbi:MAG: substrate-binding domain-containing protein [Methanospirillaceae archaeon]|nr:substrate-binding domain-containing protein [Methanospirillaceae archaeon]